MKQLLISLLLTVSLQAFAALPSATGIRPQDDYKTIRTDHFELIFPLDLETEARHSAAVFERAHSFLAKHYQYKFKRRITVILADNEDQANGMTSAIGHQGMILYMTSPEPYLSIGEYAHWLDNLIIHEYTHYLTLDRAEGFFEITRFLFGDLLLPNHAWPGWLAEGLAVEAETLFTESGRGNGAYYNTLTRDALYNSSGTGPDGFLAQFDQVMGDYPDFPSGETAYYVGYGIVSQMTKENGPTAAGRLSEEGGHRIPYFLNGTLKNVTGDDTSKSEDFRTLLARWISSEKVRMSGEFAWLKKSGSPPPKLHTKKHETSVGATVSPDEQYLAYTLYSGDRNPSLVIRNLSNGKETLYERILGGAGLSWSRDSKKLFFSQIEYLNAFDNYSDLYALDVARGSFSRLTQGARAKDPDLCTGKGLVFTSTKGRFSQLRIRQENGTIRTLYEAPAYHRISTPRCSFDGRNVYFTEHDLTPFEFVSVINLDGDQKPRRIFGGKSENFRALFPQPLPDGEVAFTRGKDTFFDLAVWDPKTGRTRLTSRSSGGYWMPRLSFNTQGTSKLASLTYVSSTGKYAATIDTTRLINPMPEPGAADIGAQVVRSGKKPAPIHPDTKVESTLQDYFFGASTLPRIWQPILGIGVDRTIVGLSLVGWDDVDSFNYSLTGVYDVGPKAMLGDLSTNIRLGSFILSPAAKNELSSYYVGPLTGKKEFSIERAYGMSVARPIPSQFSSILPSIYALWARTTFDGDYGKAVLDPEYVAGASLDFDSRLSTRYALERESGWALSLEGRRHFTLQRHTEKAVAKANFVTPVFFRHSILDLKGYLAVNTHYDPALASAIVRTGGQGSSGDLNPPLRGYPLGVFRTTRSMVLQSELRVPLVQVFNGFDTWPIFLKNLGAYGFFDTARMALNSTNGGTALKYAGETTPMISGYGGGLMLNTTLGYHLPVQLKLEYSHGMNNEMSGEDAVTLLLN